MSNVIYKKDLHDVALAVAQGSKNYTDKVRDSLRWELGTYDLSVETVNGTTMLLPTPANTIQATMVRIDGASKVSENTFVIPNIAETTTSGITWKVQNGIFYFNGTANASFSLNLLQYCTLTTNVNIKFFDIQGTSTKSSITQINSTYSSPTTSGTSIENLRTFRFFTDSGQSFTNYSFKIMVVSGTTPATSWSLGFEGIHNLELSGLVVKNSDDEVMQTLPIDLTSIEDSGGNKLFEDGSLKGNENVRDIITPTYQESAWDDVVLNGTENWTLMWNQADSGYYSYRCEISDIKVLSGETPNLICDKFNTYSTDNLFNANASGITQRKNNPEIIVKIGNTSLSTAELFKTWLANNPITFQFERATHLTSNTNLSQLVKFEAHSNGSITLVNTNNQDTASTIKYLKEVAK